MDRLRSVVKHGLSLKPSPGSEEAQVPGDGFRIQEKSHAVNRHGFNQNERNNSYLRFFAMIETPLFGAAPLPGIEQDRKP